MSKQSTPVLLAITLLLFTATLSMAFGGPKLRNCNNAENRQEMRTERMEQRLSHMTTALELTESQQTQIRAILTAQQALHEEQRAEECRQQEPQKTLTDFDEAEFRAHAQLRIERQIQRIKTEQKIFALLTTEQQEKAEIFFHRSGKRGAGHHGKRCSS